MLLIFSLMTAKGHAGVASKDTDTQSNILPLLIQEINVINFSLCVMDLLYLGLIYS